MKVVYRVIAAVCAISTTTSCAGTTVDADESTAAGEDALSDAGGVTVIQCNPFFAGRYASPDRSLPVDYSTARRFANSVAAEHSRAAVIGMEEMLTQADTDHVRGLLDAATHKPWASRFYQADAGELGVTIFWRTDVLATVQDYGIKVLDRVDKTGGAIDSYAIPFGGMLFQMVGTDRQLAVYSGKFLWNGTSRHGHKLSATELDAVRVNEANELMAWIDATTAAHPKATRVVTMDNNAGYDSTPRYRMRLHYIDGEDDRPTFKDERLDFVFWDYDSGAKRSDGILAGPVVSASFGSDHRYVATRVYVRSASE